MKLIIASDTGTIIDSTDVLASDLLRSVGDGARPLGAWAILSDLNRHLIEREAAAEAGVDGGGPGR